jgi:hypothetical protein
MQITPANASDIPALCELLALLFSQEADFKPDFDAQSRGLARIISNPEVGIILVARQGSQVLGMVNLLYTVSTALGDRVALLEVWWFPPTLAARLWGRLKTTRASHTVRTIKWVQAHHFTHRFRQ